MAATDIVREIDGNFPIPDGLKNAIERLRNEDEAPVTEEEADLDIQIEFLDEEESELDEEEMPDGVAAPDYIEIISQTVRTAPDGRQVVDVVIDVEEVDGAIKYDVRITKF